jgi:acyl dehydratase
VQHRSIAENAALDFEVRVTKQRILGRGAEFDLHTKVRVEGVLAWESLVTFFTPGRFGKPEDPSPLASSPLVQGEVIESWRMPEAGAFRMGRFTGDHNGIHLSDRYARAFGFRRALYHPPMVLGHCFARLASFGSRSVTRLDAWLKGPVYKGSVVTLVAEPTPAGGPLAFALRVESDDRPALVGRMAWDVPPTS